MPRYITKAKFEPGEYDLVEGVRVRCVAPFLLVCKEHGVGIGLIPTLPKPYTMKHIRWLSVASAASLAGVDKVEILRRIRDGWHGGDITKPEGWQRVVDARRDGITHKGVHDSIEGWAKRLNMGKAGFMLRLGRPDMPMDMALRPCERKKRLDTDRAPEGVTDSPTISPSGSVRGQFYYRGAVDTLAGHCRHLGIKLATVRHRLRRKDKYGKHMSLDEALSTPVGSVVRADKGVKNGKKGFRDPLYVRKRDRLKPYPAFVHGSEDNTVVGVPIARAQPSPAELAKHQADLDALLGPMNDFVNGG
jgi:hypothetical protein